MKWGRVRSQLDFNFPSFHRGDLARSTKSSNDNSQLFPPTRTFISQFYQSAIDNFNDASSHIPPLHPPPPRPNRRSNNRAPPPKILHPQNPKRRQNKRPLPRHPPSRRQRIRCLLQPQSAPRLHRRSGPGDSGMGSGTTGHVHWR